MKQRLTPMLSLLVLAATLVAIPISAYSSEAAQPREIMPSWADGLASEIKAGEMQRQEDYRQLLGAIRDGETRRQEDYRQLLGEIKASEQRLSEDIGVVHETAQAARAEAATANAGISGMRWTIGILSALLVGGFGLLGALLVRLDRQQPQQEAPLPAFGYHLYILNAMAKAAIDHALQEMKAKGSPKPNPSPPPRFP